MSDINNELKNCPTALVTGSARRIGASINQLLHQRGFNIAIHCNQSTNAADELCIALNNDRPGSSMVIQADLSEPAAPEHMIEAIKSGFGRLDLLVNNASSFYPTPVGEITQMQWDQLFASNARAPLFLSQAAAPLLKEVGGNIVSILDIHVDVPLRQHTVYCMAKAAHHAMVKSLAKELAPEVRVNGIAPGAILWPEAELQAKAKQTILERVALQRPGEPQDIAKAVSFFALDAPYITGQILAVDGGRSLHR